MSIVFQIISWLLSFGLSHLLAFLVHGRQGQAFIVIEVLITLSICCQLRKKHGLVPVVLGFLFTIGFMLLTSFAASKIFSVDFYAAYQILTLGECLCPRDVNSHEDEDDGWDEDEEGEYN